MENKNLYNNKININGLQTEINNTNVYENFWINLIEYWEYCYTRIKHIINDNNIVDEKIKIIILKKINSYLNNLPLDISYTYGEINNIHLENYNNIIEIYISPILNKNNVEYMNKLYEAYFKYKNSLPGLMVSKYRIFNKKNKKILGIDFTINILSSANLNNVNNYTIIYENIDNEIDNEINNENIKQKNICDNLNNKYIFKVSDILYTSSIGKNSEDNIILHLVIVFNDNIKHFFEKKKIIFENNNDGNLENQRDIWICNNNAIDIILENYIGEENLINYIGYIEILYINEADKNIKYNNINELINEIELVRNNNNILYCNLCNHNSNQLKLSKCSKCKKVYYCNKICQKIDYINHKLICN